MSRLGYPCMNIYLRRCSNNNIRCNRTAMKKSIDKHGVNYVSEKCQKNLEDLLKILKWNLQNNINFYRVTSDLIPWFDKHKIKELDNSDIIYGLLSNIGNYIVDNNIRVSFHPDHFVKLASDTESTVNNSIKELEYHGKILDLMGLEKSEFYPINIHIGAVYEGKEETAERLINNYQKLSDSVKKRLVLENDDKKSCWSVSELKQFSDCIGTPIVLDTLHHKFSRRNNSTQEAFEIIKDTWSVTPVIHHSNSKKEYENADNPRKHTNWIYTKPNIKGEYDTMIEAGKKEQALLKYKYEYF